MAAPPPAPKNLKLLAADTDIRFVMQSFNEALGVQCTFCHMEGDFAAGLLFDSAAGAVGVEDWVEYGKRRFVSVLAGDSGATECFPSCGVSGTSLCFDSSEFMN